MESVKVFGWNVGDTKPYGDAPTEQDIEASYAAFLESEGKRPQRQVQCRCGTADIVTEDAVYEVKRDLDRNALYRAIGQVLLYRMAINPVAAPKIVTNQILFPREMIRAARQMGIEVIQWSMAESDVQKMVEATRLQDRVERFLAARKEWVRARDVQRAIGNGARVSDIRSALMVLRDRGVATHRHSGKKRVYEEWSIGTPEDES